MGLNRKTAIIGSAIRAPVDGTRQALEELLYDVAQQALADAGLGIDDIDGIVVASTDQFDGRAISVMMASGSVGGVDRDILSTPSAGEHAFVMGVLRVASGQYRTQLVLSWSPTEAHPLREAERLAADPYFHRRLPLDDLSSCALQASALTAASAGAAEAAAMLARTDGVAGGPDPKRWPLTGDMVSAPVTGAVALVIADEAFVAERRAANPAWIRGMGWATEPGFLGDRDLTRAPALDAAAAHAFAEAGFDGPALIADVVETSAPTPFQTLLALESLGLSSRESWKQDVAEGRVGAEGKVKLNPSGGAKAANAVFCTGMISIAEAANQVRGCARRQVPGAETALAHAASGFAMQYQTVVVFGRQP
jgi:acetyl-CoA C-acetyltransferase